MAEKLWRIDTTKTIETYVRTQNRELEEELNVHHSKSDIKLFQLRRKNNIEEDVLDKPYAQYLRDTYIVRFPQSWKARVYLRINWELEHRYTTDMRILRSPL